MSQAEFKRRLKALMLRPENQVCSDCPERQPRWASLIKQPPGAPPGTLPMGAFCCLECSGSHRRLGVHISFVRSINLDSWKETEVLAMENGGNAKVNTIFEARLNVAKPTVSATGPVRERFIRDKYERRKFYDPAAFEKAAQMEASREQERVVSGVQRRLAGGGSRKPSDAARRRVEERAAKKGSVRSPTRAAAPKAPAAPAPVVDLLDFGNFDSFEATSAVQASVATAASSSAAPPAPSVSAPVTSNAEPQLDLFANMSIGTNGGGEVVNGVPNNPQEQARGGQPQQQQNQSVEQQKMSNADILSMFNTPSAAQHNPMQQNTFAMNGNMGMMGGGQQQQQMNPQQQMGMVNNQMAMMQNQMMGGQQQQQQMQNNNMMGGQQMGNMNNMGGMNNMMGGQQGGGMGNMGGNNMNNNMMGGQQQGMVGGGNTIGMMQPQNQGQMQQMNNMMGGGGQQGGGGGMGNNNNMTMQQRGNQFSPNLMMNGGQQMMQQPSPQKQQQQMGNQFADFGNFGR